MRNQAWRGCVRAGIVASLVVLATIVGGAPMIGSGSGQIPLVGGQQQIWPPTPPVGVPRFGTRVSVTAGKAAVHDQNNTNLGMVPAGFTAVFEGEYTGLTLKAMMAATDYSFECRGPTDGSYLGIDRLIGQGVVPLPANGGSYRFYGAAAPYKRLVLARVQTGAATITDGTNALASVDSGDWTFCSKNTTAFGVTATAAATIDFAIHELGLACGPLNGTATAQTADDTDSAYLDGGLNLSIQFTNNGPGTVTVTAAGGAPPPAPLPAGATCTYAGNVTQFQWTYSAPNTTVSFQVYGL